MSATPARTTLYSAQAQRPITGNVVEWTVQRPGNWNILESRAKTTLPNLSGQTVSLKQWVVVLWEIEHRIQDPEFAHVCAIRRDNNADFLCVSSAVPLGKRDRRRDLTEDDLVTSTDMRIAPANAIQRVIPKSKNKIIRNENDFVRDSDGDATFVHLCSSLVMDTKSKTVMTGSLRIDVPGPATTTRPSTAKGTTNRAMNSTKKSTTNGATKRTTRSMTRGSAKTPHEPTASATKTRNTKRVVKGPVGGVQKSTTKRTRQAVPAEDLSTQLLAQAAQTAPGVAQTEPTIRLTPEECAKNLFDAATEAGEVSDSSSSEES